MKIIIQFVKIVGIDITKLHFITVPKRTFNRFQINHEPVHLEIWRLTYLLGCLKASLEESFNLIVVANLDKIWGEGGLW